MVTKKSQWSGHGIPLKLRRTDQNSKNTVKSLASRVVVGNFCILFLTYQFLSKIQMVWTTLQGVGSQILRSLVIAKHPHYGCYQMAPRYRCEVSKKSSSKKCPKSIRPFYDAHPLEFDSSKKKLRNQRADQSDQGGPRRRKTKSAKMMIDNSPRVSEVADAHGAEATTVLGALQKSSMGSPKGQVVDDKERSPIRHESTRFGAP